MNRQFFDRFYSIFVFILLALFLAGCGDSGMTEVSTTGDPDKPREDDGTSQPSDKYLLVPLGELERIVNVTDNIELKVQLYVKGTGTVVEDQEISFEILETSSEQVGSLSTRNTSTTSSGIA